MSTFKEVITQILQEAMDAPPAMHQEYQFQFDSGFVDYIKHVENGIKSGYDTKKNKWFPHKSVEGGTPTIGYGHKLQTGENYQKGITEDEAIRLLNRDLMLARSKAQSEIDKSYGVGIFNQLPLRSQEMLTDFVFNLGSLRSFPKFTRAVLMNDVPTIMREYKRFTNGRELSGRNKGFYNRYLASYVQTKTPTITVGV